MVVTCIVLAGGSSLRLGRDKALERIGGRSLIQRVIERLSALDDEILVVTSSSDRLPDIGVRKVLDSYPASGALVGIYSGLKAAATPHSLVVGCDMPFINIELLRYIVSLAPGFDVVIPRLGDEVEPLHAVYSSDCIEPIEQKLSEGRFKIADLLPLVRVRYVERDEVERFDPRHLSFFNVNSEAELERARELAKDGAA